MSDDYARGYEEAGWLAEHNRIYNLVYMAINDYNSNDALIFGQIMYWHGKTSRGKRRLRVEREGYFWLAKSYKDWEKEMLLKERTVRDCLERIEKRGLIEKRIWMFNGLTTVHVRVKYEVLQEALDRVAHLFLDEDESELDRREASIGIDGKRQSGSTGDVNPYTESTSESTSKSKKRTAENSSADRPAEKPVVLPRVPKTYEQVPVGAEASEERGGEEDLPALVRLLNRHLGKRLKIKAGSKVYKQLAEARVVQDVGGWQDPDAEPYVWGQLLDHYDESPVFRQWVHGRVKWVTENTDPDDRSRRQRLIGAVTVYDHPKFGYWAFRKTFPGIANEPCEKAFQAAIKKRLAPAAQPRYSREDREAAFRSLSPEERWWLRMNAITVTSRERVIGGWEKLHDGGKNQRDWEVSYPKEWEGDPPAQLSEGEQYWLGRMRESIAEAQELWGHIVPEDYEKEL